MSTLWVASCGPCGKRGYQNRKAARKAAQSIPKNGAHLTAYRCPHGDYWHLGHLPAVVRTGEVSKQVYQARLERW